MIIIHELFASQVDATASEQLKRNEPFQQSIRRRLHTYDPEEIVVLVGGFVDTYLLEQQPDLSIFQELRHGNALSADSFTGLVLSSALSDRNTTAKLHYSSYPLFNEIASYPGVICRACRGFENESTTHFVL